MTRETGSCSELCTGLLLGCLAHPPEPVVAVVFHNQRLWRVPVGWEMGRYRLLPGLRETASQQLPRRMHTCCIYLAPCPLYQPHEAKEPMRGCMSRTRKRQDRTLLWLISTCYSMQIQGLRSSLSSPPCVWRHSASAN